MALPWTHHTAENREASSLPASVHCLLPSAHGCCTICSLQHCGWRRRSRATDRSAPRRRGLLLLQPQWFACCLLQRAVREECGSSVFVASTTSWAVAGLRQGQPEIDTNKHSQGWKARGAQSAGGGVHDQQTGYLGSTLRPRCAVYQAHHLTHLCAAGLGGRQAGLWCPAPQQRLGGAGQPRGKAHDHLLQLARRRGRGDCKDKAPAARLTRPRWPAGSAAQRR